MLFDLITGPVHSGKTTRLAAWCAAQPLGTVGGVLQPDRPGGRVLVDLLTGEETPLTAPADALESGVQRVGRFAFSAAAFEWAAAHLAAAAAAPAVQTIVIDEIGPLELRGHGLDGALRTLLAWLAAHRPAVRVVLVVREALADAVGAHYDLN